MLRSRAPRREELAGTFALAPVFLFVLLVTVLPLLFLLLSAWDDFGGLGGLFAQLWGNSLAAEAARSALQNSLVQGGLSALFAFAIGYPVGLFVGRHRFPGRGLLLSLLLVTFLLPSLVVVLGIKDLFGPLGFAHDLLPGLGSGLAGIVLANVYFNVGVVALFTVGSVENASLPQEEAASVLGASPGRIYRDVWGGPSLLGGGAGALLTFLFSFLSFAPPLLLGGPGSYTVEVWIYTLSRGVFASTPLAFALASWVVLFLALPSLVYLSIARRTSLLGGVSRGFPRLRPVSWRAPATYGFLALTGVVVLGTLALLGSVLLSGFRGPEGTLGLGNVEALFSGRVTGVVQISTLSALGNSLFFATLSVLLVLGLSLVTAFARPRHRRLGTGGDLLLFLPLLVSPVILALALEGFYASTLAQPPYLWMLIVLSESALALPFALQAVTLGLRSLPPEPTGAARTLGASSWRAFVDTQVLGLKVPILSAALFTFALGLGEFTATNFLYVPPYTTWVVEIYVLGGSRLVGPEAALAALLVLVSLALFLGIHALSSRRTGG